MATAWQPACAGVQDGFAFAPVARWGQPAAQDGMLAHGLSDAVPRPWGVGGGCGGAAISGGQGSWARAWAGGLGGDEGLARSQGGACAGKGGGCREGGQGAAWENRTALPDCDMEDSLLACGTALMTAFSRGDALADPPEAGRALACSPVLTGGAMTADIGRWDLVLGKGLPNSFLGGRSDTLRSIATQGGEEEDAYVDYGGFDEDGRRRLFCEGGTHDNSRGAPMGQEWFLSRSSWSSEDDLISIAGSEEGAQLGMERQCLEPFEARTHEGIGRFGAAEGDGQLMGPGDGGAARGRATRARVEEAFGVEFGMDLHVQDGFGGGRALGRLAGGNEAQLRRGLGLQRKSSTVLTDRRSNQMIPGLLLGEDVPRPQFPSLTSVFGSCNSSNRAFLCMPGPGHRPHLPSLNSIFGTCGSSCISSRQPPLPSLTSVFGSCNGRSAEGRHRHRARGLEGGLTECSVCLTVYSDLDLEDGLVFEGSYGDAAALGGGMASLACVGCSPGRDEQGCNSIRDEGCTMLREGADHPYFDAEWNLIPMLNELWGEEADDVPKKRATIKAKVLYQALKNVPLVPQQHVLSIRNLGEGSYGRVALGFCPGLGEIAVKWNKADDRPTNSLEFQHEAAMLATLNHPNVMGLLGLVTRSASEGEVVGFMTEFAPYGTLSAYIRRTRRVLPLKERLFLALQVARGMAFIHSCDAVHFDLKPDNVLVQRGHEQDPLLKVADLGLARWKVDGMVKAPGSLRGTLPYMAPELVCDVPLVSDKVDVWAFGCMLQEMATLEVPYSDMLSEEIVMGLMEGWLQPPIPMCEPEWQGLLEQCLAFAPQSRPSFEELSCRIAALHNAC
eukprot:evm.model.scf_1829.2 EVM.evm.TU.scf_1829.2   scf_1829:15317-22065(+)